MIMAQPANYPIFRITFLILTCVKTTFIMTTEHMVSIGKLKNDFHMEHFILNSVEYWNMKQPKMFIRKEVNGQFLLKHLSNMNIQPLVRSDIRPDGLEDIRFADATQIIVADKRQTILKILNKLTELRILHKRGLLILVCTDCKDGDDLITGQDAITTIILCNPISIHNDTIYNIRKLRFSYRAMAFTTAMIGSWNRQFGFALDKSKLPLEDNNGFFNLEGKTLEVLIPKTLLYIRNESSLDSEIQLGGILGNILKTSSQMMNFTYRLTFAKSEYGDYDPAKYEGVIDEFIRTRSDICLGIFSISKRRADRVSFTTPYSKDILTFKIRTPSKINAGTWMLGLKLFNKNFWLAIILLTTLMGMTLIITLRHHSPKNGGKVECTPIFLSIISLQGNECTSKSQSSKIVILTSYLFYWMIFAVYNGILVSFLTLDNTQKMTTMDEIIQSDHQLYVTKIGHIIDMLKVSKNAKMKAVQERIGYSNTMEEGVRELCSNPKYAHAFDAAMFNYLITDYPSCEAYSLKEIFFQDYYHLLTQKNSVLGIRLSKLIDKMKEVGLLRRMEQNGDVSRYLRTERPEFEGWVPIYFHHVFLQFGIITVGGIASTVVLLIEIVNRRLHKIGKTRSYQL